MNDEMVDRYLARIECTRPEGPTLAALRDLQLAHLLAVPFENLSIHLGEPIVLDEAAVVDKLVDRRRGGFCYELNGAFALLLRALGYDVSLLAARVFDHDALSPPFDHLVLRVTLTSPWLVDVGFGDHSLGPLAVDDPGPQQDPAGVFEVTETPGGDLDVARNGVAQCRIELRPREWVDFVPLCWWHQTSPQSHFTQTLVCSRALRSGGRVTLSDRRLIETVGGRRVERGLTSDAEVLAAYREHFGIILPSGPPHLPPAHPKSEE